MKRRRHTALVDDAPAIKYVLYSHYGAKEQEDFKAYSGETPTPPDQLSGVEYLSDHMRGLKELLTTPGHEGILVLFYAPGFEDFLVGMAQSQSDEEILRSSKNLRFASDVAISIRRKLAENGLADRVRFLTSLDLRTILGRVTTIFSEMFRRFFVGPAKGIRYDTPKIVEAILRLRLIGNGVPVLRLDHDVIFRDDNRQIGDLGLFKAVACAVRAYQLRLDLPSVSTFLFSASYDSRALLFPTGKMDAFEAWSRAFATRIYPALVADVGEIGRICCQPSDQQEGLWNAYVKSHIEDSLARQFYGLTSNMKALEPDGLEGLVSIGAHPTFGVISGALLCLSEGAILDLPPFSNFRNNVMWIDDHLKYSLHRAMYHFTSGETLDSEPGLSDARLDDVRVTKARPAVKDLPSYVFGTYLPTLLWGTVMDAWITHDPILKCRAGQLSDSERLRRRQAFEDQAEAPLPRAMLEALRIGHFAPDREDELRDQLISTAIKRIEKVRQLWAKLYSDNARSFAYYWATGTVRQSFGERCIAKGADPLWEGIAPGRPLDQPLEKGHDLTTVMHDKVSQLCDDAVQYVHWTLKWPQFIQIVRSVRQGTFAADLSWRG